MEKQYKRLFLIGIVTVVWTGSLFAQINWTKHTISDTFDGAWSVYAIDMDSDSDMDVLGAANTADDITWWENMDDSGTTWTEHTITDNFDGARSVFAIDMDNDNDVDVLSAGFLADDITGWVNDGTQNFTKYTIDDNFNGATSVHATDMDNDNDLDILAAAQVADEIVWWENNGAGVFAKHTIATLDNVKDVRAADINGDDTMDVIGMGTTSDIAWYEPSTDTFIYHWIVNCSWTQSIYTIDLDNDGDEDIVRGDAANAHVYWYENDGSGQFQEHIITSTFNSPWSLYATDLDDDDDIDVVAVASGGNDKIAWFENDGNQNFTVHIIDDINGYSVYAIDMDSDGDVDILAAGNELDEIVWWESDLAVLNVGPVSIDIDSVVPEGTVLSPQATVTNLGTLTETFDVICEIDPGAYSSTQTITDLASGDSIQVTFSPDFTFATGTYTVTVYTMLPNDEDPANDTLTKVVETYDPGITEGGSDIPRSFAFNVPTINRSKTYIKLALPKATKVDLLVYDAIGRVSEKIVSDRLPAGNHNLHVDLNLPAGVYFYNLKTGSGENVITKLILLE
jgi:hypothetical protein